MFLWFSGLNHSMSPFSRLSISELTFRKKLFLSERNILMNTSLFTLYYVECQSTVYEPPLDCMSSLIMCLLVWSKYNNIIRDILHSLNTCECWLHGGLVGDVCALKCWMFSGFFQSLYRHCWNMKAHHYFRKHWPKTKRLPRLNFTGHQMQISLN